MMHTEQISSQNQQIDGKGYPMQKKKDFFFLNRAQKIPKIRLGEQYDSQKNAD